MPTGGHRLLPSIGSLLSTHLVLRAPCTFQLVADVARPMNAKLFVKHKAMSHQDPDKLKIMSTATAVTCAACSATGGVPHAAIMTPVAHTHTLQLHTYKQHTDVCLVLIAAFQTVCHRLLKLKLTWAALCMLESLSPDMHSRQSRDSSGPLLRPHPACLLLLLLLSCRHPRGVSRGQHRHPHSSPGGSGSSKALLKSVLQQVLCVHTVLLLTRCFPVVLAVCMPYHPSIPQMLM